MFAPPYDIFQVDAEGVLWLASAETAEEAAAKAEEFAARKPGEYLVLNHITGEKTRL
jgi:hypothetical protein